MAISYINTTEVESIAKELNSLTNELNEEINNLFTRFSEVPTITQEWVGKQSNFYFNTIANNKKQYVDFINGLKGIGRRLNSDVHSVELCIKKNFNEESI